VNIRLSAYEALRKDYLKLQEENDLQRDSIQQLSAQVAGLQKALKTAIYELGLWHDSGPRKRECGGCWTCKQIIPSLEKVLTSPDPGAEIRERLLEAETHAEIIDKRMKTLLEVWQKAHPEAHYWPDLGDDFEWMMERMAKLEAVADEARHIPSALECFGNWDDCTCENCDLCKAFSALEGDRP